MGKCARSSVHDHRNRCSRSAGISVHHPLEWAFTITGIRREWPAIPQIKRRLPDPESIFVTDNGFVALNLLAAARGHVCVVTRVRLDAALYKPPPTHRKGLRGRSRLKGDRLPPFKSVQDSKRTAGACVVVSQWCNAE